MRVPFYDFNHILLLASQNRFSNDGKMHIKDLSVHEPEITLYFSDYVKSQIHCNVTEELFKRDRDAYIRVYRGDDSCLETVKKYFIEDAKNFLLCNDSNVKLTLILDFAEHTNLVDDSEVSRVKEKIIRILKGESSDSDMLIWLCHNCADLSEVEKKIDSYATINVLENER